MAYDFLYEDEFGFGFRDQVDYDTPATDGAAQVDSNKWLAAESVRISLDRQVFEGRRAVGAPGASSKRGIGAKSGTCTFRHQIRSQLVTFDGDAAAPSIAAPELDLLDEICGQTGGASVEWGGAVGTTPTAGGYATQSPAGTGTPLLGGGYWFGPSKTDIRAFAVRKEGAAPYTFWVDTRATLVTGWKVYGGRAFAPIFNTQPVWKTFDIVGANSGAHEILVGMMPQQCVLEMDPKGQLFGEFTYSFTDMISSQYGGLSATRKPIEYQAIPPFLGTNNARMVVGANVATGNWQDATANVDGHAGITNVRATITCEQSPLDAHHGLQGVADVKIRRRGFKLEFNAPKAAEFNVGGVAGARSIFLQSLLDQSQLMTQLEVGTRSGQLFGMFLPNGVVVAEPGTEWVAGRFTWKVVMEAMEYYGEASSAGVGQTAWRLFVA